MKNMVKYGAKLVITSAWKAENPSSYPLNHIS